MPSALRSFRARLAMVVAAGFGIRAWAVLATFRKLDLGFSDNFFYVVQARAVAQGKGFLNPFLWERTGAIVPAADHPPLYTTYLALWSKLGLDQPTHHRLASCLLGAGTVAVVGLVARRLGGDRAGLLAAGVAAVFPALWLSDATLTAESPYALLIALTLLASLWLWDAPSWRRGAVLGAVVALAALTRAEAVILYPLLVVPLVGLRRVGWRPALAVVGAAAVAAVAVMGPWVVYNLRRFDKPVYLSVGAGFVLKIANCDQTYHGRFLGYWNIECAYRFGDPEGASGVDSSVAELDARAQATGYIRDNLDRVPVVVAARIGRLWGVFRPSQDVEFDRFFERRGDLSSWAGLLALYAVVPLAVAGAVLVRRGAVAPLTPFIAMAVMVTISAASAFGITRYRIAADVALVALAGVALDRLVGRVRHEEARA